MNIKKKIQTSLLNWFDHNKRKLPWRENYQAYHVWISEIMLQQTQMDRVVDYYERWMKRFPDIQSIASAEEEEILHLWEGLGYYTRARNIYKSAKILSTNFGKIPADYNKLLQLPGIGKYTAGAIMSIAFNKNFAIIDANVERVFSRLFNIDAPVKDTQTRQFITQKAEAFLPDGNARMFNQALMEFGALVCSPVRPSCHRCPVNDECISRALDIVDERPVPGKSTEIIHIKMSSGVLRHKGKVFIQKRPENGVWANLWEFPGGRIEKGETPKQALVREFKEETEFDIELVEKIKIIKHSYTRYRVVLHCFLCSLISCREIPVLHEAQRYEWVVPAALNEFAFPSPHRQLIRFLFKNDLFS